MANSDKLDEASDAEGKWKAINESLKARGDLLWSEAALERARAKVLDTCINELYTKLCCMANTGYLPDYQGIALRAQADVNQVVGQRVKEMQRLSDRYHTGINADVACELHREGVKAVIGAVTKQREEERRFAWEFNFKMLTSAPAQVEQTRQTRAQAALQLDQTGGEFLASAGKNYAFLADSLRKSAQLDSGAWASLGGLIAAAATLFFGCSIDSNDDCCPEPATPP
jgi:hypothetical protein